jgi:hypothetical protein
MAAARQLVRSQPFWQHPFFWAAFQVNGLAGDPGATDAVHLPDSVIEEVGALHGSGSRGGLAVDADDVVRNAEAMLGKLNRRRDRVLAQLDEEGLTPLARQLDDLVMRATEVQTQGDLIDLARAIHELVEETPALRALLLPTGWDPALRGVGTLGDEVALHAPPNKEQVANIAQRLAHTQRYTREEAEKRDLADRDGDQPTGPGPMRGN